jgi:hypothetical protein
MILALHCGRHRHSPTPLDPIMTLHAHNDYFATWQSELRGRDGDMRRDWRGDGEAGS